MTVIREDRVITIASERGMRGRDGDSSQLVSADVTNAGSYWTMVPDAPVVALGVKQVFFGLAPAAHSGTGLAILIADINGAEQRAVKLPDGTTNAPITAVPAGCSFGVQYKAATGHYQLIWPTAPSTTPQTIVFCDATVVGSEWRLVPKAGYAFQASPVNQELVFVAPEANSAPTGIVMVGLNDGDRRAMQLPGTTTTAPAGTITSGGYVRLKFKAAGTFELLHPQATSTIAQAQVRCTITGTANALTLTAQTGYTVDAAARQTYGGYATAENTAGMTADVVGVTNGDIRHIRLPGGVSAVPAGTIKAGGYIEIVMLATGLFELVFPAVSSGTATLDNLYRVRSAWAGQTSALSLARVREL